MSVKVKRTTIYFDQHSGAAHSKHLSKYVIFMFFTKKIKKNEKARKLRQNGQKMILSLNSNTGQNIQHLFPALNFNFDK